MRISTLACAVLAGGLLVATPLEVCAQSARPNRMNRFLFGGTPGAVGEAGQEMTLTANLSGGYDGNSLGSSRQGTTPTFAVAGAGGSSFAQAAVGLSYEFARKRFQFSASGGGTNAYYSSLKAWSQPSRRESVAASYQITRHLRLSGNELASSQPAYMMFRSTAPAVFSQTQAPPSVIDQTVGVGSYSSFGSNLALSYDVLRRVNLFSNYSHTRGRTVSSDRDYRTQVAGAGVRFSLTKGLGLRIGYSRQLAHSDIALSLPGGRRDGFDVGLDFNRALSLSRTTTLSFTTGVSGLEYGDDTQTHYRFVGSARLVHEIGRTWTTGISLKRDAQFVEAFGAAPVLSDSMSAGLHGLLSRRFSVTADLGMGKGLVGLVRLQSNNYTTTYGSTTLTIALTRDLAAGVDYSAYRNRVGSDVVVPAGFSRQVDRHAIRAFLTLRAPMFQRTRRTDASRQDVHP